MELKDTIDLMISVDYPDRFKAEYHQTYIRHNKLSKFMTDWANGLLDYEPICSWDLLASQRKYMEKYLEVLRLRAETEGISLEEI